LEVSVILDLLAAGHSIKDVLRKYADSDISAESIKEAVQLAKKALLRSAARSFSMKTSFVLICRTNESTKSRLCCAVCCASKNSRRESRLYGQDSAS